MFTFCLRRFIEYTTIAYPGFVSYLELIVCCTRNDELIAHLVVSLRRTYHVTIHEVFTFSHARPKYHMYWNGGFPSLTLVR